MSSSSPLTGGRSYTPRILDGELDILLAGIGAVSIDGAKAVGKTATAMRRAARTVRLDQVAVAEVVRAAPAEALRPPFPVFFDEWQHVPAIWDAVRQRVDDDPTPALALLAGSAAPPAKARPTHTGAGRIVTRRMRPLTISERLTAAGFPTGSWETVSVRALLALGPRPALRGESPWTLTDYAREIVASGFPAIRTLSPVLRRAQLDGYVRHLTTRDVQEANGAAANPATIQRWLQAYAAATATTTSLEKLRHIASAGDGGPPAKATAMRYRDALERLFIYDPVPAWRPGGTPLSRLGEAPKIHLVDPGLSAHLLGIDEEALLDGASTPLVDAVPALRDGGLFGALFESLVALSMRTYAQATDVEHLYVRTHGGEHEVDGLLVRRDQRCVAYEVKLAGTITENDVRHLHWLKEHLGDQLLDAIVVHTGPAAYRRDDGIGVVPAALLVP
jgi:predicted AAA+ superfamily ATPase